MDWSARGWARVYVLTVLGTLGCIGFAFVFDSYSFESGAWRWGSEPLNNLLIPLLLAAPLLFFLLNKMRQLAVAHHELMTVATTDSLTSLLNRRAFTAIVDGYFERLDERASQGTGALLVLDVDHFKAVNDRFGHDVGDEALKLIAKTVRDCVRDSDAVARMGGEEFGVFLPGLPATQVAVLAERIRSAVSETAFVPAETQWPLSISIGGVTFAGMKSFSELYRSADEWLYEAKHSGRNRVVLRAMPAAAEMRATVH